MTYDDLVKLALELPNAKVVVGKGGPGVNHRDRCMFWLKKWELLCIHVDWENHDRLLADHPGVVYKTPHFEEYPAVHAHLEKLSPDLARVLIKEAWTVAPNKIHFRRKPKS